MKKSLFVLAALACLGFTAVGCGGDDSACDGFDCSGQIGTECQVNLLGIAQCVVTKEACDALGDDYESIFEADGITGKCQKKAGTSKCTRDSECSTDGSMICNKTTGACEYPVTANAYKYVRIDDLTVASKASEDLGADIDAIVLVKKSDGSKAYASEVKAFQRGDIDVKSNTDKAYAYDPEAALHEPDALITYGTSDAATCNYYKVKPTDKANSDGQGKYTFVSLGGNGGGAAGAGGYLIVAMEKDIENGDTIDVIELGDCKIPGNTTFDGKDIASASTDPVKVSIGISDAIDGDWSKVIVDNKKAVGGVISGTVSL